MWVTKPLIGLTLVFVTTICKNAVYMYTLPANVLMVIYIVLMGLTKTGDVFN